MNIITQIKELTAYLNSCRNKYYNQGTSEIPDQEYDALLEELEALENSSGFKMQNSPTTQVGYKVLDNLPKAKHPVPLLSANKTKSLEDLIAFAHKGKCVASVKCDGLTTNVYVENGKIIKGVTRGDGEIGQDVTNNIPFISNLPYIINTKENLRVTGESVIFDSDFQQMKDTITTSTGEKFSNSRNMASGSLTLVDNKKFAKRNVKFVAFNVEDGFPELNSLSACYEKLNELGFTVVPYTIVPQNVTMEQMKEITETLRDCANKLGLPQDGVVLRYDSRSYSKSLGRTEKYYKDMIAYKFENDWYNTILTDIEWNTSRTGYVVPTAIFKEVDVNGVKISRATLNNLGFLRNLKLHIGDTIAISRRNEVIPYVEKNFTEHDLSEDLIIPNICPCCGADLIESNGFLICPNKVNCTAQTVGKINHFASKSAMNIEGLSEATIELLVNKGWIDKPRDLYHLSDYKTFIIRMDGFGEKSYTNMIGSIEKSRHTTLDRLIVGLGIPNIGKSAAKTLAKHYDYDFNKFYEEGINQVIDYTILKDFGETTNKAIKGYFYQEKHTSELKKLASELCFEKVNEVIPSQTSPFSGKSFCITGTFGCGKRSDLQKQIESLGGTFVSSVSKKTDILVAGDKCGSKLDKAKSFGTRIIEEPELIAILSERK